jgi:hypothetical protein
MKNLHEISGCGWTPALPAFPSDPRPLPGILQRPPTKLTEPAAASCWRAACRGVSGLLLALSLAAPFGAVADGLEFSVDPGSPEPWSPADILLSDGSAEHLTAAQLGLPSNVNVDGFSYGRDEIEPVKPYYFTRVAYSVDRLAEGNGGAITAQVNNNGAAGDKFQVWAVGYRGRLFTILPPRLVSDAPVHNLSELPNQSDLDGLSLVVAGAGDYPVYFSVPPGHASWAPGDVVIKKDETSPPEIFATAAQLGLSATDDIDALAIGTFPVGGAPPLALGPNVVVWVSLAKGSPGRIIAEARGGDGVIQVFPGPHKLVLDAPTLDLKSTDEMNALTGLDPGRDPDVFTHVGTGETGRVDWHDGTSATLVGGGHDIWSREDHFDFVHRRIHGDFDVRVQIVSFAGAWIWSKVGLMARESLEPASRMAFAETTPARTQTLGGPLGNGKVCFQYRTGVSSPGQGENADGCLAIPNAFPDCWVRLARRGTELSGYFSSDGRNWTLMGTQDTGTWEGGALPSKLYMGLAVSRHSGPEPFATAGISNYADVISDPVTLTRQPADFQAHSGATTARFEIQLAGGADPDSFAIQWYENGTVIPGAIGPDLAVSGVGPGHDGRVYHAQVVNRHNRSESSSVPAKLSWVEGAVLVHADDELNPDGFSLYLNGREDPATVTPGNIVVNGPEGTEIPVTGVALWESAETGNKYIASVSTPWVPRRPYTVELVGVMDQQGSPFSKKTEIRKESSIATTGLTRILDMVPQGNIIHGVNGACLKIYNTSDPSSIEMLSETPLPGAVTGVAVDGTTVLTANGDAGVCAISVVDPRKPVLSGCTALGSFVTTVAAENGVGVAGDESGNVTTLDLTGAGAPAVMGGISLSGPIAGVAMGDNNAVVGSENELHWVNLDNPASPVIEATEQVPGQILDLDMVGDSVLVGRENGWSLFGSGVLAYEQAVPGGAFPVTLDEGLLTWGTPSGEIQVNNITDPFNPVDVDGFTIPEAPISFARGGGFGSPFFVESVAGLAPLSLANGSHKQQFIPFDDVRSVRIKAEIYSGIGGTAVDDLTQSPGFPNHPNVKFNLGRFELITDFSDNYGASVSGLFTPDTTGDHEFFINSDDRSKLYMSKDENPANKQSIAYEPNWGAPRQFESTVRRPNAENRSSPQPLIAGESYYMEALMKEGGGGDNLAVAVRLPGGTPPKNGDTPLGKSSFAHNGQYSRRVDPGDPTAGDYIFNPGPVELAPRGGTEVKVPAGGTTSFGVDIFGSPLLEGATYKIEWSQDGLAIPGQHANSLTASVDADTVFKVEVWNGFSSDLAEFQVFTYSLPEGESPGTVRVTWSTGPGEQLFPGITSFPRSLTVNDDLEVAQSSPNQDHFELNLSAFIRPAVSGDYTFYLNADDAAQLFLSSDATPENLTAVVSDSCCDGYAISPVVSLAAGKPFLAHFSLAEFGGGDHASLQYSINDGPPQPAGDLFTSYLNNGSGTLTVPPNIMLQAGQYPVVSGIGSGNVPALTGVTLNGAQINNAFVTSQVLPEGIGQYQYGIAIKRNVNDGDVLGLNFMSALGGPTSHETTLSVTEPTVFPTELFTAGLGHSAMTVSDLGVEQITSINIPGGRGALIRPPAPGGFYADGDVVDHAGFDEFLGPHTALTHEQYPDGDFDAPGTVNAADLRLFQSLPTPLSPVPRLNNDHEPETVMVTLKAGLTDAFGNVLTEPIVLEVPKAPFVVESIPLRYTDFGAAGGTSFRIGTSGGSFWNGSDGLVMAHQAFTGDFDVMVKRVWMAVPNESAKAGLMVRHSTAAGAPALGFAAKPRGRAQDGQGGGYGKNVFEIVQRSVQGGNVSFWDHPNLPPCHLYPYMRIKREGEVFTAFISRDGATWIQAGQTTTFTAPETVLVGPFASSNNGSYFMDAIFDKWGDASPVGVTMELLPQGDGQIDVVRTPGVGTTAVAEQVQGPYQPMVRQRNPDRLVASAADGTRFYRAGPGLDALPRGDVHLTVQDSTGSPLRGQVVSWDTDEHFWRTTNPQGELTLSGVPAGRVTFWFEHRIAVIDPVTGVKRHPMVKLPLDVVVSAGETTVVLVAIGFNGGGTKGAPPCDCLPWTGILVATLDGETRLVAGGGERDQCGEATVTLTAPGGHVEALSGDRARTIPEPAAGSWNISASVCAQSAATEVSIP